MNAFVFKNKSVAFGYTHRNSYCNFELEVHMRSAMRFLSIFLILMTYTTALQAQDNPFGNGWTLDSQASTLQFQSIKNGSTIETSSFATLEGEIDGTGGTKLTVLLDSVDTKVDLRNVRMRFLFFETFAFPLATITAQIEPEMIADLASVRRKAVTLPFTLDLHGVTKTFEAQLAITLIGDDLVAVSTAEPLNIKVADFALDGGLTKLQEAANVAIVPSSAISFDFIFRKSDGAAAPVETTSTAAPATAALETEGDFSIEACVGRFEILSRSGNIYFKPGSARLADTSAPLLSTVADIIRRCPGLTIQVAGHTDSVGSAVQNQRLSESRAASVVAFLRDAGVSTQGITVVGFGEDRPIADNGTDDGRGRNRRIEFSVTGS